MSKFLLFAILLISQAPIRAQNLSVTAIATSPTTISINWTHPISGAFSTITKVKITKSFGMTQTINIQNFTSSYSYTTASPATAYLIQVDISYQIISGGPIYKYQGSTSVITPPQNPTGGVSGGSCTLENYSFSFIEDFGDYVRRDGELIISWIPPINTTGGYKFRYKKVGSTDPWSYTPIVATGGFTGIDGNSYSLWIIGGLEFGGIEYEVQAAKVCADNTESAYGTSYYAYTIVQ